MAETAAILTLLLDVGKLVYRPIKRQYKYLFCLNSNVLALQREADLLEVRKGRLNAKSSRSIDRGQVINDDVTDWFTRADGIKEEVRMIVEDAGNVQRGCLGIKSRYSLSKKAMKMAEEAKLHRDKEFDGSITHSPPPPAHVFDGPIPIAHPPTPPEAHVLSTKETEDRANTMEFQSRKEIEEEIMKVLREATTTRLGIWGMGGLGKTTMAKIIMMKVKEELLFNEVLMVVVGQDFNLMKIQQEIAEWFGLKLDEKSDYIRAQKLYQRLSVKERILIVIDDIWNAIKLEDIGIPGEGVTILLTSRHMEVLKTMNAKKFGMEILVDEEPWDFFKVKAQIRTDDDGVLVSKAKEVAKECKGLPLALEVLGCSLKGEKKIQIWKDTLYQLKNSNIEEIPEFIKDVYPSLKLSYDKLEGEDAKKVFLLCSQFPEDWDINLDDLALYCVGLHLFEKKISLSLDQTRNRLCKVVEMLKSRSLLLDGSNANFAKMHDVVRDVAGIISGEESSAQIVRHCKFILYQDSGLPSGSSYTKFEVLYSVTENMAIPNDISSMEGMKDLNVLHVNSSRVKLFPIPMSIKNLKNLRTLYLGSCKLDCISVIGELLELEILRCLDCGNIKELTIEMKELKHLKLLEFRDCSNIKRIAPGIIPNLVKLEELTIWDSFDGWESIKAENVSGNACLKELESLQKLRVLKIEIANVCLVEEDFQLNTSCLANYGIRIGRNRKMFIWKMKKWINVHARFVYMNKIPIGVKFGSWVYQLVSTAEEIFWKGAKKIYNGMIPHELVPFENLKGLSLHSFPGLTNLGKFSNQNDALKINIRTCDTLKNLFFFERAERVLFGIKSLGIINCSTMEELFYSDDKNGGTTSNCHVILSQLKTLVLSKLPCLGAFVKGVELIELPLLSELVIDDCPKLTRLMSSTKKSNSEGNDNNRGFHLFNNREVAFGPLEFSGIPNTICESSNDFKSLEKLSIINMPALVHIFSNGENKMLSRVAFSKLKELVLRRLRNLESFYNGIESINFPVLETLKIIDCPNFVNIVTSIGRKANHEGGHVDETLHLFCCPEITFGSLKYLKIIEYHDDNIWCHQILPCFFRQLERLWIGDCGEISILFSSSIVENLENLDMLSIFNCNKMKRVIGDKERVCDKHIIFPSLTWLNLDDLPLLGNFCEWSFALELPLLDRIDITKCPKMKCFTPASLNIPKLKTTKLNKKYVSVEKLKDLGGLNAALIQHHQCMPTATTTKEEIGGAQENAEGTSYAQGDDDNQSDSTS